MTEVTRFPNIDEMVRELTKNGNFTEALYRRKIILDEIKTYEIVPKELLERKLVSTTELLRAYISIQ